MLALAGLAILSTAVAYVLFFRILATAGATNLMLVTFLIPVSAILLGVLVLGEFLDPEDAAVPLFGSLGFPSLEEPEDVVPLTTRRRIFAGYAGWGAGQLEDELAREDWILEEADNDDAFTETPDELWADVLRRKGGIYEIVARMPDDPSVN